MGNVGILKSRALGKKKKGREVTTRLCFVAVCMCLGVVASATQGDDFLNVKEGQLTQLVAAVQNNEAMKCELLKTCTNTACSRNTCLYQKGDVNQYKCMAVDFNKYCNASDGGPCGDKNFDYNKSFVRTAGNTDFTSYFTTIGTCSQRALDPVFQNISKPDSLLRVYFGSIDGSWRGFPGSDQDVNDPECIDVKYDTRLRPWYRASTSVPKVVAILIDAEQSMGTTLSAGLGQGDTILNSVKNIVTEFLKTLSAQDYVNIIMFNSSKATPLSSSMVQVIQNVSDVTASLPELNSLRQSLAQQQADDQPGTSNVTRGIDQALLNFGTKYPDAAKIILILTDGKFATGDVSIPTAELASSNIKVFVYKIFDTPDDNLFLQNTSFTNQLCSIGGSFEVISSDIENPVLVLNSFFTFTATLHAAVTNYSADYSIIYPGYEEIEGNISTVCIPVFGAEKNLLGVIGMNIYINSLGNLTELVYAAILRRSLGKVFHTQKFQLTKADCSLQTALPSRDPCPADVAIPPNGGFCPRTDMSSTIEDLACCKSCAKPPSEKKPSTAVIAGSTVASVIVAILVALILLWVYNWWKDKTKESVKYVYPGPPNDTSLQAGMNEDQRVSPS